MPVVYIPALLAHLTGGKSSIRVKGANVRQIIDQLERTWPGLRDALLDQGRLRANLRVAVDGRVSPLGLLAPVGPSSEVHFIQAVGGG